MLLLVSVRLPGARKRGDLSSSYDLRPEPSLLTFERRANRVERGLGQKMYAQVVFLRRKKDQSVLHLLNDRAETTRRLKNGWRKRPAIPSTKKYPGEELRGDAWRGVTSGGHEPVPCSLKGVVRRGGSISSLGGQSLSLYHASIDALPEEKGASQAKKR